MDPKSSQKQLAILLIGDLAVIAFVTAFGFASHGTLGSAGLRILSTFIPLSLAWLGVAPFMGVYQVESLNRWQELFKPFWAMVVCAPLASWMRAVWLNAAIQPLFVVVLGGVASLAILAWRIAHRFWYTRGRAASG